MSKNLIFIVVLFLFSSEIGISQEVRYLDDNLEPISRIEMDSRCNNQFYKCLNFTNDTLYVKKVFQVYKFGKLDSTQKIDLNQHISTTYNNLKDKSRNLFIVFRDTLQNFERRITINEKFKAKNEK